jgi:hypothetical protein
LKLRQEFELQPVARVEHFVIRIADACDESKQARVNTDPWWSGLPELGDPRIESFPLLPGGVRDSSTRALAVKDACVRQPVGVIPGRGIASFKRRAPSRDFKRPCAWEGAHADGFFEEFPPGWVGGQKDVSA